jgi:hypothetical protein
MPALDRASGWETKRDLNQDRGMTGSMIRWVCRHAVRALLCALAALAWLPAAARAGVPEITLPEGFSAVLDLRLVGADGERAWTDGGFGKSRFGAGGDGDFEVDPVLANAQLVWQPDLGWNFDGTVSIAAQDDQDQPVDLVEAFLRWRPVPRSATRFSARVGLFWPHISLEHEGPAWSVSGMITPSAINSWIGEEVKVIGLEVSVARDLGGAHVEATLGTFGFNDTAGTLLSFRGWALHDQKTAAFSEQRLPPLNYFMQFAQASETSPTIELDDRPGFYAGLSLRMAAPVTLQAFYYSNRGRPEAVTESGQWGWDTRFLNLGGRVDLGEHTRLLAQAMLGHTEMGIEENGRYWVDTRFRSAFVRLGHDVGAVTFNGRLDLFDTRERGSQMEAAESEEGWALTGAVDWRLSSQAELIVEALHIDSERGTRARAGLAPEQAQNVVQASLRVTL